MGIAIVMFHAAVENGNKFHKQELVQKNSMNLESFIANNREEEYRKQMFAVRINKPGHVH